MPMPLENLKTFQENVTVILQLHTILFKLTSNVNTEPGDLGGDGMTYTLVTRTLNLVTHQPESVRTIGRHYGTSVAMATP